MNILLIGSGGREHALAWKIAQSARLSKLYACPGNPGIARHAECRSLELKRPFGEVTAFCREREIDLVVVGPEAPLAAGIADMLEVEGICCFGPVKEAAQLESSKSFAREIMSAAGVSQHEYFVTDSAPKARDFYRSKETPWWIKADGLAAGKGSVRPATIEEGCRLLGDWLEKGTLGPAGKRVVIEEPLEGREISVIAMVDGEDFQCLVPSRDHKRLLEGDLGPNTGGMGAFAPVGDLNPRDFAFIRQKILKPTLRELTFRGIRYQGVLYAGIMLTGQGPRLLEYNVRLGDPEAQVILPLMENDFLEVAEAVVRGKLNEIEIKSRREAAMAVVCAAEGYPGPPRKGDLIDGLAAAEEFFDGKGMIFHAGTREEEGRIVTAGGRVLGVTVWGEEPERTRRLCYEAIERISWEGMQFRRDIGQGWS